MALKKVRDNHVRFLDHANAMEAVLRSAKHWDKLWLEDPEWFCVKLKGKFFDGAVSRTEFDQAKELQATEPVSLLTQTWSGKTLWWYKEEFYIENDGYTSEEVKLLLWEREQRRKRKFQRLRKEMLSERALEEARREKIREDVRIFVWRRDEGRCVQCGSQENLEFDHVIPISKGGNNTARNIQLLCETCNRRKSDRI